MSRYEDSDDSTLPIEGNTIFWIWVIYILYIDNEIIYCWTVNILIIQVIQSNFTPDHDEDTENREVRLTMSEQPGEAEDSSSEISQAKARKTLTFKRYI